MSRKYKRTLSLLLALIMICSTIGVMAFAQERANLYGPCENCNKDQNFTRHYEEGFNRIIGCPMHFEAHDAEEWYIYECYTCDVCGWKFIYDSEPVYKCII